MTGDYVIAAGFASGDNVGATTGAFVLRNGVTLATGNVDSGTPFTYSVSSLALTAGDLIDFAVGYGPNNNYGFDNTVTVVTIAAVPEPATWGVLVGAAALGCGVWRRRRVCRDRRSAVRSRSGL